MLRGTAPELYRPGAGWQGPGARAARPCRQGCSPAAVGYGARGIFLEIFVSTIYFLKIKLKRI
jgi:hypothetical protein